MAHLRRRDAGPADGARRRRQAAVAPAELDRMKALVREAMEQGAVGRVDVAAVPARAVRHDRGADRAGDRGRQVRRRLRDPHAIRRRAPCSTALDEAIRIGREAKIPVEIWHVKAAGKQQLGPDEGHRREASSRRAADRRRHHARTLTRIQPGSTRCPRSSRRGRTTAGTRSSSRG